MSKPSEGDLRDAKGDLVDRLNDMSRKAGVIPDTRKSEDIANQVIHKISKDKLPDLKPQGQEKRDRSDLKPGDWYGEPGHSGKIPESVAGETVTFFSETLGDYEIGAGGKHAVRPLDGAPTGARKHSDKIVAMVEGIAMTELMVRDLTKLLWSKRDWRRRLRRIVDMNDAHKKHAKMESLFADAFRVFGPPIPRTMVPKKIVH